MGKENFHTICLFLAVAWLAGCEADMGERMLSGRVMALHGLQGRWVGPVVPADASCGRATQGLMSIGEKGFGFDPFQSTIVIQGEVGKDGRLAGSLVRQGGDRQSLSISFEAKAHGAGEPADAIDGVLLSGRCRWQVTLHRG